MKKKYILFSVLFALQIMGAIKINAMPLVRIGDSFVAEQSLETKEIVIKLSGSSVRVMNASGKKMEVYSVTGKCVLVTTIDTNDKTVSLPSGMRGIYIIKVDTVTKPVSFR